MCRAAYWTQSIGGLSGWVALPAEHSRYSVHLLDIMKHALASPSEEFSRHSIYMQLEGAQVVHDEDDDGGGPLEVGF
jgi:hypothetical protein